MGYHKAKSSPLVPTVFTWPNPGSSQPQEVLLSGSFNGWQPVLMSGSGQTKYWCIVLDLPEGEHTFKFLVDGQWMHNPKENTVDDGMGGKNNVIAVSRTDFEVFDALAVDGKESESCNKTNRSISAADSASPMSDEFTRELPPFVKASADFGTESSPFSASSRLYGSCGPPLLPPQLLQVILNKETPLTCEPTLLPQPNHVMLNHLYALSIQDNVMVLSTTQRYRKKYVTTLLYRPIE